MKWKGSKPELFIYNHKTALMWLLGIAGIGGAAVIVMMNRPDLLSDTIVYTDEMLIESVSMTELNLPTLPEGVSQPPAVDDRSDVAPSNDGAALKAALSKLGKLKVQVDELTTELDTVRAGLDRYQKAQVGVDIAQDREIESIRAMKGEPASASSSDFVLSEDNGIIRSLWKQIDRLNTRTAASKKRSITNGQAIEGMLSGMPQVSVTGETRQSIE